MPDFFRKGKHKRSPSPRYRKSRNKKLVEDQRSVNGVSVPHSESVKEKQSTKTPYVPLAIALVPLFFTVSVLASIPRILGPKRGGKILSVALSKAFRGGLPGFAAAIVQITSLMWLRTLMNYQYKTGLSMKEAGQKLWKEGGISRFYRGIVPALALVPLARFGDTASNAGVLALLEGSRFPVAFRTATASLAAACWRIVLMPLETLKVTLQVDGLNGLKNLVDRLYVGGTVRNFDIEFIRQIFNVYFRGTVATIVATWLGHYPWFATRNALDVYIYNFPNSAPLFIRLLREAFIGIIASVVSDLCTNAIRVVKTVRQTSGKGKAELSYTGAFLKVINEDGLIGLFRGLSTKTFANILNSIIFNVFLKVF